ncbi:MAG TPA: amidase, partial [Treponemataceae bacterium]|nr:amidase [Treponemataceae bacterium]
MNICDMSLTELKAKLESGELTSLKIVEAYKASYEADEKAKKPLKGYVEFYADALDAARKADEARASGDRRPLLGLPFAVKDNISIRGKACTCGSKILAGYVAPYNATVAERLIAAGAVPMGRTNMDEFAMGSSTEYSCYGPSRNPVNRDLVPGGSSGGSAAVVAGGQAPF